MNHARIEVLRRKISSLGNELAELEVKRDEIIQKRCNATSPNERVKCAGEAGAVIAQIRHVEKRIHHARRLLAHAQGDEYQANTFLTSRLN